MKLTLKWTTKEPCSSLQFESQLNREKNEGKKLIRVGPFRLWLYNQIAHQFTQNESFLCSNSTKMPTMAYTKMLKYFLISWWWKPLSKNKMLFWEHQQQYLCSSSLREENGQNQQTSWLLLFLWQAPKGIRWPYLEVKFIRISQHLKTEVNKQAHSGGTKKRKDNQK